MVNIQNYKNEFNSLKIKKLFIPYFNILFVIIFVIKFYNVLE